MYTNKNTSSIKTVVIFFGILFALIFDVTFGTASFPVLTSIVCGIVVIYELVSPFIYSSR